MWSNTKTVSSDSTLGSMLLSASQAALHYQVEKRRGTACCVPGCRNTSATSKCKVSMHLFPQKKREREEWLRRIGRGAAWTPTKSHRICGAHFNKSGKKQYMDKLPRFFPNRTYKTKYLELDPNTRPESPVYENIVFHSPIGSGSSRMRDAVVWDAHDVDPISDPETDPLATHIKEEPTDVEDEPMRIKEGPTHIKEGPMHIKEELTGVRQFESVFLTETRYPTAEQDDIEDLTLSSHNSDTVASVNESHATSDVNQSHASRDVDQSHATSDVDQSQATSDVDETQVSSDVDQSQTSFDVTVSPPTFVLRPHAGPSRRFQCPKCNLSFNYKPNLETHLLLHSGKSEFNCGFCGGFFTSVYAFYRHTYEMHDVQR